MKNNWQTYLLQKDKRIVLLVSNLVLVIVLYLFYQFLAFNEVRKGFVFNDPILNLFSPIDVSFFTFFITYSLALSGILIAFRTPSVFVTLIQAYAILTLLRIFSLFVFPLEAPVEVIPLNDVFLNSTFYGGRENLKDLFFSGHTATILLFAFVFSNKIVKGVYFLGAFVIAILVTLQHVHFSIDVLVAPVFAYIAVLIQRKINFQ
ncbi:MAG: hypothetical protein A3F72_06510 [Bacteroidetes bacterium RIFCSPLOWO2_12_FULL_35_15]|nr:MAG: hypothetical protein A3F72_06510 [Bacteroidetes bacterium RIFCSPLOWO2_12_FULL_35_15]